VDLRIGADKFRDYSVAVPPKLNSPPLVVVPEALLAHLRSAFLPTFMEVARRLDIPLQSPDVVAVQETHAHAYRNEICQFIQQSGTPSFVLVVFPDSNQERYDVLKQLLTIDLGIPSQFAKAASICVEPPAAAAAVCTNILIQIAAKTGGIPWFVSPEVLPLRHTIVIGIAVSSKRSGMPMIAMSASYDHTLARYKTAAFSSPSTDPIVRPAVITEFIAKAMKRSQVTEPVERVVVFRSGVSYGWMDRVKQKEVPVVASAIEGASLVYCIVKHKTPTRFLSGEEGLRPGTFTADKIASKDVPEFFLLSNDPHDGVGIPARYTVIHHSPAVWSDDQFVQLCHYLTASYPNPRLSCPLPAPLRLAGQLADLSRENLGSVPPNDCLSDYLHFI
jgi:aubergine-like protein